MSGAVLLETLLDLVTQKRTQLDLSLRGVNGYTGRGDISFAIWADGNRKMDVALRGVAGRVAEIYANGALAGTVDLNDGKAGQSFDTRRGHAVPELSEGAQIDIRQNGEIILEGAFVSE